MGRNKNNDFLQGFYPSFSDYSFHAMPFKISFSITWLSWQHIVLYYFSNKERKRFDILEVYAFFCLVIFHFNQSKNNAVLEPRKGDLQGLEGCEAKDFKMCPRSQGHPQELHLC